MTAQRAPASKDQIAQLFVKQRGLITTDQARGVGMSNAAITRKVKGGEWIRVFRSVYRLATAPVTWEQTVLAACLYGGPDTFASHQSAGALWRLDGLVPRTIHVTSTRRLREAVRCVRVSSIPAMDRRVLREIPVTSVERTLVDLAALLDPQALEIALDSALRMNLTSLPRLRWQLQNCSARAKGRATLAVLVEARSGISVSESVLETKILQAIAQAGLPKPVTQFRVMDGTRFVGRFDLAYPTAKVIIEADGYRWHSGRAAWHKDRSRDNDLNRLGWTVLRYTAQDLRDPRAVAAQIKEVLYPKVGRS